MFKHGIRVGSVSPDRMLDPLPFADKARPGDRKALAPPLGFLAELAVVLLSEHPKPLDGLFLQATVSQLLNTVG